MAETLKDWLNGEVNKLSKLSVGELSNTFFFRDPLRSTHIDYKHFYSPADGTILYQKLVQPGEQVLEIKGVMNFEEWNTINNKSLLLIITNEFISKNNW